MGPSLGKEAIQSGIYSFLIALLIVLLWMIFYYGTGGLFADIALALNILLIFGILAGFRSSINTSRNCRYRFDHWYLCGCERTYL